MPKVQQQQAKPKFTQYDIRYVHIDLSEVRCKEGKCYGCVAIERTSKFAYTKIHPQATKAFAAACFEHLTKAVPYKSHTGLTAGTAETAIPRLIKPTYLSLIECVKPIALSTA